MISGPRIGLSATGLGTLKNGEDDDFNHRSFAYRIFNQNPHEVSEPWNPRIGGKFSIGTHRPNFPRIATVLSFVVSKEKINTVDVFILEHLEPIVGFWRGCLLEGWKAGYVPCDLLKVPSSTDKCWTS